MLTELSFVIVKCFFNFTPKAVVYIVVLLRRGMCRRRSWSAFSWSSPTRCPRRSSSPQRSAPKSPNTAAASEATNEPSSSTKRRLCTVKVTARSVWPGSVSAVCSSAAGSVHVLCCIWTRHRPAFDCKPSQVNLLIIYNKYMLHYILHYIFGEDVA